MRIRWGRVIGTAVGTTAGMVVGLPALVLGALWVTERELRSDALSIWRNQGTSDGDSGPAHRRPLVLVECVPDAANRVPDPVPQVRPDARVDRSHPRPIDVRPRGVRLALGRADHRGTTDVTPLLFHGVPLEGAVMSVRPRWRAGVSSGPR